MCLAWIPQVCYNVKKKNVKFSTRMCPVYYCPGELQLQRVLSRVCVQKRLFLWCRVLKVPNPGCNTQTGFYSFVSAPLYVRMGSTNGSIPPDVCRLWRRKDEQRERSGKRDDKNPRVYLFKGSNFKGLYQKFKGFHFTKRPLVFITRQYLYLHTDINVIYNRILSYVTFSDAVNRLLDVVLDCDDFGYDISEFVL